MPITMSTLVTSTQYQVAVHCFACTALVFAVRIECAAKYWQMLKIWKKLAMNAATFHTRRDQVR